MRVVHGRLAGVSVWGSFGAGAWVGAALGVVVGAMLGALFAWFCGAILDWQRDLGFTLGITRTLLPFGDQIGALRWISGNWYWVIPGAALAVALISGLVGGVIGALLAAAYNRSPRHATVAVELPEDQAEEVAEAAAAGEEPGIVTPVAPARSRPRSRTGGAGR
ncbi:MAG TPA: hypothetical protein VHK28_07770 [Candidatus Limnocylindria bacterium]|nr:hypothetical protein [Candidatus Limnocylindria bacterium]